MCLGDEVLISIPVFISHLDVTALSMCCSTSAAITPSVTLSLSVVSGLISVWRTVCMGSGMCVCLLRTHMYVYWNARTHSLCLCLYMCMCVYVCVHMFKKICACSSYAIIQLMQPRLASRFKQWCKILFRPSGCCN